MLLVNCLRLCQVWPKYLDVCFLVTFGVTLIIAYTVPLSFVQRWLQVIIMGFLTVLVAVSHSTSRLQRQAYCFALREACPRTWRACFSHIHVDYLHDIHSPCDAMTWYAWIAAGSCPWPPLHKRYSKGKCSQGEMGAPQLQTHESFDDRPMAWHFSDHDNIIRGKHAPLCRGTVLTKCISSNTTQCSFMG